MTMTDVVETLFDLREDDLVALEAQQYEWSTPFEVAGVSEEQWLGATGEEWTVRELALEPGYKSGQSRTVTVMTESGPPSVGNYGQLVDAEIVERGEVKDDDDEPASALKQAAAEATYLDEVADELDVSIQEARALAHDAGVYKSLREASRYNGASPPGDRGGRV